jgi:hypothetical protein
MFDQNIDCAVRAADDLDHDARNDLPPGAASFGSLKKTPRDASPWRGKMSRAHRPDPLRVGGAQAMMSMSVM